MLKFEYILFDLDGVLIKLDVSREELLKECTSSLNLPSISSNEYLEAHLEFSNKRIDTRYKIFKKILESKEVEDIEKKTEELKRLYREKYFDSLKIVENAFQILDRLKDRFLFLVTNGPKITVWDKIKNFNLDDYFDRIIISGEIGIGKPNPEIFQRVLNSKDKRKLIMIGNSRKTDIKGARNVGIKSILVKTENTERRGPKADWEVNKLEDILEIIFNGKEKNLN